MLCWYSISRGELVNTVFSTLVLNQIYLFPVWKTFWYLFFHIFSACIACEDLWLKIELSVEGCNRRHKKSKQMQNQSYSSTKDFCFEAF